MWNYFVNFATNQGVGLKRTNAKIFLHKSLHSFWKILVDICVHKIKKTNNSSSLLAGRGWSTGSLDALHWFPNHDWRAASFTGKTSIDIKRSWGCIQTFMHTLILWISVLQLHSIDIMWVILTQVNTRNTINIFLSCSLYISLILQIQELLRNKVARY